MMIIADSQTELDEIACPSCGQTSLKMTGVLYSCPLQFDVFCENCSYKEKGSRTAHQSYFW